MLNLRFVVEIFLVGVIVVGASVVSGQDYPNKTIRIVAGSAGGGGDFVTRLIVPGISGSMGQPVIVDNRAPVVAAETVAKAPPDGYTLLVQGVGTVWMRPLLEKVPWDPAKDFSPVSLLVRETSAIAVHPSVPAKSVKELIALAKARPGELNYASAGVGSTYHLATELFRSMAGINIVHIAYKSGPLMAAVMSGEVHMVIYDAGLLAPHVKSGKLRALAITSSEPSPLVPDLPTVAASGLPGYEAVSMTGMWAPARTSDAIINRLSKEIARYINLPDVREKFLNARLEMVGSSPEQFAAIIKADMARMTKVIKDAGIKAN